MKSYKITEKIARYFAVALEKRNKLKVFRAEKIAEGCEVDIGT